MAGNSPKVIMMARVLAIAHIIVGVPLIGFGIADYVVEYFMTGDGCFGIWAGIWMCITGGLGIPGTLKKRSKTRNVFSGVYMGFSITSAIIGGIIIMCYSYTIVMYRYRHLRGTNNPRHKLYGEEMTYSVAILILGSVELGIGTWAALSIYLMKPCDTPPQQRQATCTANTGHVNTQGGHMAIPMQAPGDMVAVQNVVPGAQGSQPQMVMVPVYAVEGYLLQLAEATPTGALATGYQTQQIHVASVGHMATVNESQQIEMLPAYEQGQ